MTTFNLTGPDVTSRRGRADTLLSSIRSPYIWNTSLQLKQLSKSASFLRFEQFSEEMPLLTGAWGWKALVLQLDRECDVLMLVHMKAGMSIEFQRGVLPSLDL